VEESNSEHKRLSIQVSKEDAGKAEELISAEQRREKSLLVDGLLDSDYASLSCQVKALENSFKELPNTGVPVHKYKRIVLVGLSISAFVNLMLDIIAKYDVVNKYVGSESFGCWCLVSASSGNMKILFMANEYYNLICKRGNHPESEQRTYDMCINYIRTLCLPQIFISLLGYSMEWLSLGGIFWYVFFSVHIDWAQEAETKRNPIDQVWSSIRGSIFLPYFFLYVSMTAVWMISECKFSCGTKWFESIYAPFYYIDYDFHNAWPPFQINVVDDFVDVAKEMIKTLL